MKHTYTIEGMHCASCTAKVREALRGVDGVTAAEVDLDPPQAKVTMEHHVATGRMNDALSEKGDYRLAEAATPTASPSASSSGSASGGGEPPENLCPLFLIVGYLLGVVLLIAATTGRWEVMPMMRHFMAGFFLVFSFFKLLDLRGFVDTYRGYDLFARRSKGYAWAYPFIELGLGIAYLVDAWPVVVNAVTLVVMAVGAVGVLRVLLDKRSIRCACLGTALNLPMTKVTLVEDLTMATMAAVMLALHLL